LGDIACDIDDISLERDIECQDRHRREECNSYQENVEVGPLQLPPVLPDPLIDYSFLDTYVCIKNNITFPFCSCTTPEKTNSCADY
jgi:hypothetical protein